MRARRRLLADLAAADPERRNAALWRLAYRQPRPRRVRRRVWHAVLRLARTDPEASVRAGALHALMGCAALPFDPTATLLEAMADPHPSVRGQAAEALGVRWQDARPDASSYEAVVAALEQALADPEPSPRFWALYAVGTMRLERLRPALEALVDDAGVAELGWTVGEEAQDVLQVLDGAEWPERG